MQIVDTPILCKAVGKELYGPCLAAWQSGDKRASSLPQDHSGEAGKRPGRDIQRGFLLMDSLRYPGQTSSLIFPKLYPSMRSV